MNWKKHFHKKHVKISLLAAGLIVFAAASWSYIKTYGFYSADIKTRDVQNVKTVISEPPKPKHIKTPASVRAIYMTGWVAGTKNWREDLVNFVKKTEINSVVIDVKDYSGKISFETGNPAIKTEGSEEARVKDMKDFIKELHDAGIYTIARITVFQDPYYAKKHPEIAVQKKNGALWRDKKGISYLDPGAKKFWDYIIEIAKASEQAGFDELNFDYIRFPSDGDMKDIAFPTSISFLKETETNPLPPVSLAKAGGASEVGNSWKVKILTEFFKYLQSGLKNTGVPISADVFGMVATNLDDLNIGQVLEAIAPYFDYVAPMVYPSHFPPTFQGFKNPAAHPYEIIHFSMTKAFERLVAASSTTSKLRPWIQDFDLGVNYGPTEVRAEIKAVYDSGLNSWMSWDAANKYTRGAYEPEN